jgi:hypothetical protein
MQKKGNVCYFSSFIRMEELVNWNGPMNFIFKSTFFLVTLATCQDLDLVFSIINRVDDPTPDMIYHLSIELIRRGNLPCLHRLLQEKLTHWPRLFAEAIIYDQPDILKFLFNLLPQNKRETLNLLFVAQDILYHAFDRLNIEVFEILMDEKFILPSDLTPDRLETFIRYNRCDIVAKIMRYYNDCSMVLFSKDLFFVNKCFALKSYAFLMAFIDNNFVQPYDVADIAVEIEDTFFLRKLYAKYNVGDNFYLMEYAIRKNLYRVVEFFVLEHGYPIQKLQGNSRRYMDLILRTRTRAANKIFFMVGQYLYSGKTANLQKFVERMASKSYDSLFPN